MDQWGHQERRGWTADGEDARALRVPKTAELVADHFRAQIIGGALFEGDHLPSEAALTELLGIARPTLREALRILETEGLIAVTRGARTGAKVLRPTIAPVARHVAMLLRAHQVTADDLFAARLAIEPDAVATLCAKRDPDIGERLQAQLGQINARLDAAALDQAIAGLNQFHVTLVESAGNQTLSMFAAVLRRLMAAQQRVVGTHRLPPPAERRQHLSTALRSCEELVALIARGETAAATAHWRAYLVAANAVWLAGAESERVVELPAPR